ncbi:MAG: hypothetical protein COA42_22540 [Alteromonadaceae bacterium]|nr:MAG: hypothetical protein COA42_22540 [Alteromonadaceae bacterium]
MHANSLKDKAVWASQTLHAYPRAELIPPVTIIDGLDTIETSGIDDSMLGHSYVGSARAMLTDLSSWFKSGLHANERAGLEEEKTAKGESYWRIT